MLLNINQVTQGFILNKLQQFCILKYSYVFVLYIFANFKSKENIDNRITAKT